MRSCGRCGFKNSKESKKCCNCGISLFRGIAYEVHPVIYTEGQRQVSVILKYIFYILAAVFMFLFLDRFIINKEEIDILEIIFEGWSLLFAAFAFYFFAKLLSNAIKGSDEGGNHL